jgi:hypothetical protein
VTSLVRIENSGSLLCNRYIWRVFSLVLLDLSVIKLKSGFAIFSYMFDMTLMERNDLKSDVRKELSGSPFPPGREMVSKGKLGHMR